MNCPLLVMHKGFYCGSEPDYFLPKPHQLEEYCYDGSHVYRCGRYLASAPLV